MNTHWRKSSIMSLFLLAQTEPVAYFTSDWFWVCPECGEGARFQGWRKEIKKTHQLNADMFNSSMEI